MEGCLIGGMRLIIPGMPKIHFPFTGRFLCFCSFVALVQLCRIQLRVPEYGALEMVLLDLPNLLFFSTYMLLVLSGLRYITRSLPINKLRPAYYSINGFMYFAQACIWISVRLSHSPIAIDLLDSSFQVLDYCSCICILAVISLCAAFGFILYGGRRFPIESRGRQKKLFEVGFVTGICCACFLLRCFMVLASVFDKNADIDVLYHPLLNLIYYMLVEILPSALVLFILRKLPPKRVSDQYHPIR
ncbi:hypothetical protein V6Z11_1Z114700 [Gossypium hirsutum]